MFAGKARINSICKIYYRTLEVVYNNFNEKHSDTSIYQKHWQYLTVEVCKTVAEINPEFMWTYFLKYSIPYDLKTGEKGFCFLQDQQDMGLIHFCSEAVFFGITFLLRTKIVKH